MAVQKSKKSKSRRNIRKSANIVFELPTLSLDKDTGETHLRHFVTNSGYYKGKRVLKEKIKNSDKNSDIVEKK